MATQSVPTVHLNGTDGTVLQTQNEAALSTIELAIEQLMLAAPHGRDYYVRGATAFAEAYGQHAARLKALGTVRDELREIVRGIRRQNEARDARRAP